MNGTDSFPARRIAFFGGAFNPPHLGHAAVARAALAAGRTDCVLWVPSWRPPHKEPQGMAPYAERLAMTRLAAETVPGSLVSDIERRKGFAPSYSLRVLAALEEEFPGARMQLLIGSDSLEELHTWHGAKELVRRYEILTYPRKTGAAHGAAPVVPVTFWGEETGKKLRNSLLAGDFVEISSTDLRNALENGQKCVHIMEESVRSYIRQHRLYGTGTQPREGE